MKGHLVQILKLKVCLHVVSPSSYPSKSQSKFNIMSMVMDPLTSKIDQESILFVIDLMSITIDMMLHFDGDFDGHGTVTLLVNIS